MRRMAMLLLIGSIARTLEAQCADGRRPPCAGSPIRQIVPVDANRVAIIPFRVATADSLLGEGLAELMANEFTGEGSPRALDMATVVGTWRRAGGGLRTPLTQDASRKVARDMGAGLMIEGSVVGLGRTVTLSASVISTLDGRTRGAPVSATGSADSLDAVLRRATSGLLVSAGGRARSETGARWSENADAMRHYMRGLSEWRRARIADASRAFDRAIEADSTFAQAIFYRYMASFWGASQIPNATAPLVWSSRSRLSRQQRTVVEGVLGPNYPAERTIEERIAHRRAAAEQLPDSPEAQYFYGDMMYHYAQGVARDHMTIARTYLARAAAIDSQGPVLLHMVELGVKLRDTALMREAIGAYSRTEGNDRWCLAWVVAAERRDDIAVNRLRSALPGSSFCINAASSSALSAAHIDEMVTLILRAGYPNRSLAVLDFGGLLAMRGRPSAAERLWRAGPVDASRVDAFRLELSAGGVFGLYVTGAVNRLSVAARESTPPGIAARCALLPIRVAASAGVVAAPPGAEGVAPCPSSPLFERAIADGWQDSTLSALDSLVRNRATFLTLHWESRALQAMWEKRGQPARALAAARGRTVGITPYADQPMWREEGRLALVVGDTAGATLAFRRYLETTRDAEPPVQAIRDSVRAQLDAIERRTTRRAP